MCRPHINITFHVSTYIGQRVKLDHFGYFKGKIVPGVSLEWPVVQSGYLRGKLGPLPYKLITHDIWYTLVIYFLNFYTKHQNDFIFRIEWLHD